MIYRDSTTTRLQKSNLKYIIYGEVRFIHFTKSDFMHIEFPNNKPIGPTMLVEWLE